MPDPLENINAVLEELEGAALKTTQGDYVKLEHVRSLLQKRKQVEEEEKDKKMEQRPPRNFKEANGQIKKDAEIMAGFPQPGPREPKHSVPATEPRPSSRT